jgi:hypothetical protein
MTKRDDLTRLHQISTLMLDTRLARLTSAARAKRQSEDQLEGLSKPAPLPEDFPAVVGQLAMLTYQRWAEARRAEINLVLARQTAEWIDARDAAREAFGRAEAVDKLRSRLPK